MFKRSSTDSRRVVIVDFAHMAWAYAFGGARPLSCVVKQPDGSHVTVDTTIPAYTIKTLHRWARGGVNPLAVCFDGVGSSRSRKAYFAKHSGVSADGKVVGYKARREVKDARFYEGINMTMSILHQGGVCVFQGANYEADDLVKACVDRAKKDYPDLPIDVVTGDHDLLPLVDDQVSVFLRSTKMTYAECKEIEKLHYVQITPRNYEEYLSGLNAYKTLSVPYNSILLAKLLRGDKSDEIPGKPDWKPKMYKRLIEILQEQGEDLGKLFRYGNPVANVSVSVDGHRTVTYSEPQELTRMCDVLGKIVDKDDIDHIRFVYNGINLNSAFTDLGEFNRAPAFLLEPIKGYDAGKLQQSNSVAGLGINLPNI